jgi:hypothetical protein
MAGYAGGALLAGFLLAFLKLGIDGRGYYWSAPLSVLCVFAAVWHQPWASWICLIGAAILLVTWIAVRNGEPRFAAKTLILVLGIILMLAVNAYGYWNGPLDPETSVATKLMVAWPWYVPIGSTVAFAFGYLLAGRKNESSV